MLTQTTITAIRILIHLGSEVAGGAESLKRIAETLGESSTYLVKIARHLVRVGILRSLRGKTGGVVLNRVPKTITLLAVVEACQGTIHGDFCQSTPDLSKACAFHRAGAELHEAISDVLSRWTLADFIKQPYPTRELRGQAPCLLQGGQPGLVLPLKKGKR